MFATANEITDLYLVNCVSTLKDMKLNDNESPYINKYYENYKRCSILICNLHDYSYSIIFKIYFAFVT